MIIIGICGGSGSGKSTVCQILSGMGASVLDCDKIYHNLISKETPCLSAIVERFGNGVVQDGKLNRVALREIVFNNKTALVDLNRITHYFVLEVLKSELLALEKSGWKYAVIDAPMFFEAKLETWCQTVCAVIADKQMQIKRICIRDQISKDAALNRLSNQIDSDKLRNKCDFIIENNGDLIHLKNECNRLIQYVDSKENTKK